MSDLLGVLPGFDTSSYTHLLFSFEKNDVTVSDLLSVDPVDIVKKCPLPLIEVRRLVADLIATRQEKYRDAFPLPVPSSGLAKNSTRANNTHRSTRYGCPPLRSNIVTTLDEAIDRTLGGGIHTGFITEVCGESAVGKTQFVLGLLLSVQLPPPLGLGRSAIYISTEDRLNTRRLVQILGLHPVYATLPPSHCPSLENIYCISTNDLETQEHIIDFQLPVAVRRYDAGLVVIDSVAANFRAEHQTRTAEGMADRATDLAKLATRLGRIAVENDVAVIVTNQVSDRFDDPMARSLQAMMQMSSPTPSSPASRLVGRSVIATTAPRTRDDILTLEHQQRFFTGWGNDSDASGKDLKTPALGLAWANLISARIVLKMEIVGAIHTLSTSMVGSIWNDQGKRRFLSMVFSPWAEETITPVEFKVKVEGVVSVDEFEDMDLDNEDWSDASSKLLYDGSGEQGQKEQAAPPSAPANISYRDIMLDEDLLRDDVWEDDEFP